MKKLFTLLCLLMIMGAQSMAQKFALVDMEYILKNIPALIILDAGSIDALKGIELCKKIRQNSDFDKTKLIVTSILHDKELILTAGADLYIPKPYEISNLIKWVEKLLNG